MIKRIINKITTLGTKYASDFESARSIEFLNQILLFDSPVLWFYSILFYVLDMYFLSALLFSYFIIFVLCLYLNTSNRHGFAKNICMFFSCFVIAIPAAYLGKEASIQFFLPVMLAISMIFFKDENKTLKWLQTSLPIASFIWLESYGYKTFTVKSEVPESIINILSTSAMICSFFMIYILLRSYLGTFKHLKENLKQVLTMYSLTERESEVISELVKGKSNKDIASILFIEESTVKNHLKKIFKKLDVKSRSELIIKCVPNKR